MIMFTEANLDPFLYFKGKCQVVQSQVYSYWNDKIDFRLRWSALEDSGEPLFIELPAGFSYR